MHGKQKNDTYCLFLYLKSLEFLFEMNFLTFQLFMAIRLALGADQTSLFLRSLQDAKREAPQTALFLGFGGHKKSSAVQFFDCCYATVLKNN